MDINFWKQQWSKAQQGSSLAKGYNRLDNWEAFWNLYAPRYALENRDRLAFHQSIIDHLFHEEVIASSDEVLDAGCGPGTFAIPLALSSAKVIGLDSADTMLRVMEAEAIHYGVADQIETMTKSWDELAEDRLFDVVFAANTPAIMNYESLMKMGRLARKACCLISFSSSFQSTLRFDLWQQIMGDPLKSRAFDIQFPFNILYLCGLFPNIRFFPYRWQPKYQIEEMLHHYTAYFELFGKTGPEVSSRINAFLKKRETGGFVADSQKGVLALIWWRL